MKTLPVCLSMCLSMFVVTFINVALAQGGAGAPDAVPDNLKPPSDQHLVLRGHASGDQLYICQPATTGTSQFAWVLSAPDAKLVDDTGKQIAIHFAGPTWQSPDGSRVKGKVLSQSTPDPDAIPWLLLTAIDHTGAGILSDVSSIQRLSTKGGKAPATGCDVQHKGETRRVSYTADYYFYSPAK
jgi:hypothetical protein